MQFCTATTETAAREASKISDNVREEPHVPNDNNYMYSENIIYQVLKPRKQEDFEWPIFEEE